MRASGGALAPTSWAFFRTAVPSYAWLERCSRNSTMNGKWRDAASARSHWPNSRRPRGAATGDVIHTAFIHDFTDFAAAVETDRRAIETLGQAPGRLRPTAGHRFRDRRRARADGNRAGRVRRRGQFAGARSTSERATRIVLCRAWRAFVLSAVGPTVHGEGDVHGLVPRLIGIACAKVCPHISATAPTAGRQCTDWTSRTCSALHSKERRHARDCTRSTRKAYELVTPPK
jgi:hypothetical protein